MKSKFLIGVGAMVMTLSSCSEGFWDETSEGGTGYILPRVEIDNKTLLSRSGDTRVDLKDITVDSLTLKLTRSDGKVPFNGKYSEFKDNQEFGIGDYTLEAFYGDVNNEGYGKPAIYGSANLTVSNGQTTTVNLIASLANALVSIKYSDAFEKYMADWNALINNIDYPKDCNDSVYVKPGNTDVRINFTKQNGVSGNLTVPDLKTEAKRHYKINVNVNEGKIGDATLEIEFNSDMTDTIIYIPISDDVLLSAAPTIEIEGFESGKEIGVISGLPSTVDLSVSIMAQAGLNSVILETESSSLKTKGWPERIDLMSESESAKRSILSNNGLSVLGLWNNPDIMGYIDFSLIPEFIKVSEGSEISRFTVAAFDELHRSTDTIQLVLKVDALKMELSSSGEYFNPGNPLGINFSFNGSKENIENGDVTFEYYDPNRGIWTKLDTPNVIQHNSSYILIFNTPTFEDNLKIRARCNEIISNELEISLAPIEVTVTDNNAYAKYTYAEVKATDSSFDINGKQTSLYLKGGNTYQSFTKVNGTLEDGYYKITNLEPNTDYQIKVSIDGYTSKASSFHTEEALEVPNGDFEDLTGLIFSGTANQGGRWTATAVKTWRQNTSTFTINEPNGWCSSNLKTMNGKTELKEENNTWFYQPSVFNSTLSYVVRNANLSDITPTTATPDSYKDFIPKNGSNAMIIRNVGWDANGQTPDDDQPGIRDGWTYGSSNYYNHNTPNVSNHSAGKLVLGTTVDGYVFDATIFKSRPLKLTGWYIYSPDSKDKSDYGVISVQIFDNQGTIIASGSQNLPETSSYTEFNVEINGYTLNSKKAEKILVIVTSSHYQDGSDIQLTTYQSNYESYMHGATLVVDDFEFIY